MAGTERSLQLVGTQASAPQGQEAFAQRVQAVLREHQDIAAEACWQAMAQLIAAHWAPLCTEQSALNTWTMLTRCAETITRLRRVPAQDRVSAGQQALEEFRELMGEVLGDDDKDGR